MKFCLTFIIFLKPKVVSFTPYFGLSPLSNDSKIHQPTHQLSGYNIDINERESRRPRAIFKPTSYVSQNDEENVNKILESSGFECISDCNQQNGESVYVYTYVKASDMLKLISQPGNGLRDNEIPRWIPMTKGEENVLVANGWSFLDPDESEPMSAYDIDAANTEGQYVPKWKIDENTEVNSTLSISSLGYCLKNMSLKEITDASSQLCNDLSQKVLLEGGTDPPNKKITCNGICFDGACGQSDIPKGIFTCAIGNIPLFASTDLKPTTASSAWLSFSRPLHDDHVRLVQPQDKELNDQRVEVVCARSRCHLGHYFGKSDGYCINASALNFYPVSSENEKITEYLPINVLPCAGVLLNDRKHDSPSIELLRSFVLNSTETIVVGGGCFWHIEEAIRRLPGVVSTEVGYAGGVTTNPTYEQVCKDMTRHAEVVKVVFDPRVLSVQVFLECFMSLHDPTKVSFGTFQLNVSFSKPRALSTF